eukprot:456215-Amphidinium_carterae.1
MKIVEGLRKLKRWESKRSSPQARAQAYAAGASSSSAQTGEPDRPDAPGAAGSGERPKDLKQAWTCPACRKHAIRSDPAHTRNRDECRVHSTEAEMAC